MAKHAIIKLINYPNADVAKAKKVSAYIQSPKRTQTAYVFGHGLDAADVGGSLETIEKRWKPKGSRLFKHGVFSFGQPDLEPEKAVEVTKEVMAFFKDYPWLAAVHTNCPHRVHSHFLLGCINLLTGRKYSQGLKELQLFKDFYGNVATRYGLPVPKHWQGEVHTDERVEHPPVVRETRAPLDETDYYTAAISSMQPQYYMPSYAPQDNSQPDVVRDVMDWYSRDFQRYFMMGVMGK